MEHRQNVFALILRDPACVGRAWLELLLCITHNADRLHYHLQGNPSLAGSVLAEGTLDEWGMDWTTLREPMTVQLVPEIVRQAFSVGFHEFRLDEFLDATVKVRHRSIGLSVRTILRRTETLN